MSYEPFRVSVNFLDLMFPLFCMFMVVFRATVDDIIYATQGALPPRLPLGGVAAPQTLLHLRDGRPLGRADRSPGGTVQYKII